MSFKIPRIEGSYTNGTELHLGNGNTIDAQLPGAAAPNVREIIIKKVDDLTKYFVMFHGIHPDDHANVKANNKDCWIHAHPAFKTPRARGVKPQDQAKSGRIPWDRTVFGIKNWGDAIFGSASPKYASLYGYSGKTDEIVLLICLFEKAAAEHVAKSTLSSPYIPADWEANLPLEMRITDPSKIIIHKMLIVGGAAKWLQDITLTQLLSNQKKCDREESVVTEARKGEESKYACWDVDCNGLLITLGFAVATRLK